MDLLLTTEADDSQDNVCKSDATAKQVAATKILDSTSANLLNIRTERAERKISFSVIVKISSHQTNLPLCFFCLLYFTRIYAYFSSIIFCLGVLTLQGNKGTLERRACTCSSTLGGQRDSEIDICNSGIGLRATFSVIIPIIPNRIAFVISKWCGLV